MNKRQCFLGILSLVAVSTADPALDSLYNRIVSANGEKSSISLAKKSATSQTSYTSTKYNITYTAPSGWYIDGKVTERSSGANWITTNDNLNAQMVMTIDFMSSANEARLVAGSFVMKLLFYVIKMKTTGTEYVTGIIDTFYNDLGLGIRWIIVNFSGATNNICVRYSSYSGNYINYALYLTTYKNFTTNREAYFNNYLGMNFITMNKANSLTKEISQFNKVSHSSTVLNLSNNSDMSMQKDASIFKNNIFSLMGSRMMNSASKRCLHT